MWRVDYVMRFQDGTVRRGSTDCGASKAYALIWQVQAKADRDFLQCHIYKGPALIVPWTRRGYPDHIECVGDKAA